MSRNPKKRKLEVQNIVDQNHNRKLKRQVILDAERARFEAKMKGAKPKLYISYGFSDLDPFTNIDYAWDLWVKFPFKVPKEECKTLKEKFQRAFQEVFLS